MDNSMAVIIRHEIKIIIDKHTQIEETVRKQCNEIMNIGNR